MAGWPHCLWTLVVRQGHKTDEAAHLIVYRKQSGGEEREGGKGLNPKISPSRHTSSDLTSFQ